MEYFDDPIARAGGEGSWGDTNSLNIVDVIGCAAGGGIALRKVVSEPFITVRVNQNKVEVVHQSSLGLSSVGATCFVGPCQRQIHAVARVDGKGIQQTISGSENFTVVKEGVESG